MQNYSRRIVQIVFYFAICLTNLIGQQPKQIEILHSNTMEYKKGINAQKLIGNVQFKHDDAIMNCDSAYFFSDENYIDAYGHIGIHQGDSLHLYGKFLKYNGNTKLAQIRKNVKLIDKETTLTTDSLDFKIAEDIGYYTNGGKIINANNQLSSKIGYYYAKQKMYYYRKNVIIINPQYVIKSDTLKYNTVTRTSFFFGPTTITSKENFIYCENGWYNTQTNISQFNKHAYLKNDKQLLRGDSLYYERNNGFGKAFGHIWLNDSTQKVISTGNYARYYEKPQYAMITDSAVFMQYNDVDTMFVHADTLISVATDTSNKEKIIRAFMHVRIFKPDMQGKCDSLNYTTSDSTMRLYNKPVIWTDANQMTSNYIELHMANQKLHTANFYTNSFIISEEDSIKFNQIKGKKMVGYFKDNELFKVDVFGNGQTLYYTKDKNTIVGLNKAESSNLTVFINKKSVKKIVFLTKPEATLTPLSKINKGESFFKDFKWYEKSRPTSKEDIFIWVVE